MNHPFYNLSVYGFFSAVKSFKQGEIAEVIDLGRYALCIIMDPFQGITIEDIVATCPSLAEKNIMNRVIKIKGPQMISYHPYPDASWRKTREGLFFLNQDYYQKSGGIFKDSMHYMNLFQYK